MCSSLFALLRVRLRSFGIRSNVLAMDVQFGVLGNAALFFRTFFRSSNLAHVSTRCLARTQSPYKISAYEPLVHSRGEIAERSKNVNRNLMDTLTPSRGATLPTALLNVCQHSYNPLERPPQPGKPPFFDFTEPLSRSGLWRGSLSEEFEVKTKLSGA